jgi:hypothetical protein
MNRVLSSDPIPQTFVIIAEGRAVGRLGQHVDAGNIERVTSLRVG